MREEISNYLNNSFAIDYNKEEICLTIGGSEGLLSTFTALINEKDKVLIPTPAYPAYESCVKLLGGQVLNYRLKDDFSIDFDFLNKIIEEEKPKIMVVSYPCNPTGVVLNEEDRDKLYNIIKDNKDIIVVTDEMYSELNYKKEYFSIGQFKDIRDRVIVVGGFSKMFSMTGLRLGYVCAVDEVMESIMKVHQYNVSCAPSIVQYGALEGLRTSLKDVDYMKSEFIKRRDFIYNRLIELGFEVNIPQGAFYIFPSIKKFGLGSEEFCEKALKEAKVAMVPGSAFGKGGEGYIRISYSYSLDELKEAMNRLESWIK